MHISKGLKKGLIGFGFLGANGIIIPTVGNNLFSSGFSLDSLNIGGGITDLISFSTKNELIPQTKLDLKQLPRKETNVDLSSVNSTPETKLISQDESDSMNLTALTPLNEGKEGIINSIKDVHSAIDVESKVKDVDEEVRKRYSYLLSRTLDKSEDKQQEHLKHFREAKEQLQKRSRSRRSTTAGNTLNQDQRISLEKMYRLNKGLKELSKELALKFKDKVPSSDISVALPQEDGLSSNNIEKALKIISWTDESIRTQKDRGSSYFFKENSWGNWDSNPFKPFYTNENEFKKDIRSLQSNAMNVHKLKQILEREWRPAIRRFREPELLAKLEKQYKEKEREISSLDASKDSHIVQKVASYLLKAMGQAQ